MKPIAEALAQLSPEARAELARPFQSYDPRNAEIVEGEAPAWYLVETYEPAQRDVQKVLVERRFGIFVPEVEITEIRRGRKVDRRLLLFPGYIFVFVWNIDQHWSRIATIPGVSQIMVSKPDMNGNVLSSASKPEMNRKLPVGGLQKAIVIDDDMIDFIRKVENGEMPKPPKRRTRGKNRRHDGDVIATYPWSAFPDRLLDLDSDGRNQTLRKALGLS